MRQSGQIIDLEADLRDYILMCAKSAAPQEMCGLLVALPLGLEYLPCRNVAENPCEQFEIAPDDWLDAAQHGVIVAVVHSHPRGEMFLSGADRQAQVLSGLPWILAVSGCLKIFAPVPHLRSRAFVYDAADCYRLVQDAYHLAGIDLLDVPRVDIDRDVGRFDELVERAGFERVPMPQAGDIVLTSHRGDGKSDHIALYLGDGQILHHAAGQLSRREPFGAWWQRHTTGFWRHRQWQPEMMAAIDADLLHSM
ncbi:C40 family peptidase [Wielerella bovis]|nr:C40 family peptidase [Wielerella bovis]ULJ68209.1 C40 family peptidase [Wielerella bovis]